MRSDTKIGLICFFCVQLAVTLIASLAFGWLDGNQGFISAMLGGLVNIIPGIVFSVKLFKHKGAKHARKILNAFYVGEAYKLMLSAVLFAIVFANYKVNALAFFISFIVAQSIYWFAPVFVITKRKRRKSS